MKPVARSIGGMAVVTASLALGGGNMAVSGDLPRGASCGLGKISAVRMAGVNRWTIDLTDVRILVADPRPAGPETEMTVDLVTGLGGVVTSPTDDWIGRTALFAVIRADGRIAVPKLDLPLSPDGSSFFVFGPGPDRRPGAIRELVEISGMGDLAARSEKLGRYIEDWSEPSYLRGRAMDELARIGDRDSPARRSAVERLLRWRDDRSFPLDLRFAADRALVDTSPPQYQLSEGRAAFLASVRDDPNSPKERVAQARRLLEGAAARRGERPH